MWIFGEAKMLQNKSSAARCRRMRIFVLISCQTDQIIHSQERSTPIEYEMMGQVEQLGIFCKQPRRKLQ